MMRSDTSLDSCEAGMNPDLKPISVDEAIHRVLVHTKLLPARRFDISSELLGKYLAHDVYAMNDYPAFPASIMDGFAVCAPATAGDSYVKASSIHAGQENGGETQILEPGKVIYITTGAKLPEGANAVIKIENTKSQPASEREQTVITFLHDVKPGENVRQIGSDIKKEDLLLAKGHRLRASELGLLASAGFNDVVCYSSPTIGVLSTGDELVQPTDHIEIGSTKIRDCNRLALLSALKEDGLETVDLGIVRDNKDLVRDRLLQAAIQCDVVISSGGVSMGAVDYIKPLLRELGCVHFGKLNMKPGKPTTFATLPKPGCPDGAEALFFGLPGNPVSCIVTKALFVDPAIKRMQGLSSDQCLHPQLTVELAGDDLALDPERPEYHRAVVVESDIGSGSKRDNNKQIFLAFSTGNQRSSRILSMRSANALLFLPQGPGKISKGTKLQSLLIGPLQSAPRNSSVHRQAAFTDYSDGGEVKKESVSPNMNNRLSVKVGLLTISDRAANGVYSDESGPEMEKLLLEMSADFEFPLQFIIHTRALVPDEPQDISNFIIKWCGTGHSHDDTVDLLLTSGGTGFGLRDLTPEAIRPLLHREAPGVAQALLWEGLKHTPLAVLSRTVVGTRNKTLVCTFPGSVKAIRENIACMKVLFPRIFELLLA